VTAQHFSVVVPVHDGALWLGETVASVTCQTHGDWELIVVDDGSSDGSASVVERISDPRVRMIRQSNAGAFAARRTGLARARGAAIVFLDADDRLRPDALARFAAVLERTPAAMVVYGDRVLADRAGRVFGVASGALLAARPSGDVLEHLLQRNFLSTPGQACIRAAALADSGEWRTDLRRMADWYLWCRLACRGAFVYCGRGPVVEYRLHGRSMSRRFTAEDDATPPHIAELEPTIEAVFALPSVRERFPGRRLAALRRQSVASAYAWKGQDLLRAGRFTASRRYLLAALHRHPAQPVDLLCLVLALLCFHPPGVGKWIGRVSE
jgi:glycosyltransferase involved in cell wall biosynthesis